MLTGNIAKAVKKAPVITCLSKNARHTYALVYHAMQSTPAILFVEYQRRQDTIRAAKKAGYAAILLTQNDPDPALLEIFEEVITVQLDERENIDRIAIALKDQYDIKGILSNYEHFVVQRSYLAEIFGIPSSSVYSACCTRNKVLQRQALGMLEENIDYQMVRSVREAEEAYQAFDHDMYLKSIAGVKSCFVEHIQDEDHLKSTWQDFEQSHLQLDDHLFNDFSFLDFDFPYPDPKKVMLAEKAYHGQQIAVASLVGAHETWHAGSPTDVYTARDMGRDDSFLAFRILPSRLDQHLQKKASEAVEKVIQVLGLQNCGIHAEMIVTDEGDVKIIEVASRLGGYRPYMYQKVYGVDLCTLLIHAVTNTSVFPRSREAQCVVSMMEIFPEKEGIFQKIEGLAALEEDENIDRLSVKSKPGERVGPAKRGYSPVLTFAILGKNYQEVYEKSLHYQKTLQVSLKT